jgi:hypothetical protein
MTSQLTAFLREALSQQGRLLNELLSKSPFGPTTPEYKNLKISILLNSVNILHTKNKLVVADQQSIILWHLPKNMTNYVKILVKEFFTTIKLEIMDCCKEASPTDDTLEAILQANWEDNYYEEQH